MATIRVLGKTGRILVTWRGTWEPMAMSSSMASEAKVSNNSEVKPFEEIPGPRGIYRLPFIGGLFHFKPFSNVRPEESRMLLHGLADKYGPIYRVDFGKPMVLISKPDDVAFVFRNEGKYPSRPQNELGMVYAKRMNMKDGLDDLQGEEWHALRAPLGKRLSKVDSATHYLEPQNAVTDDFVDILSHQKLEPQDMAELFFRYAAESIGVVCFNARLGFMDIKSQDPESKAFLQASRDMFMYTHKSFSGESVAHRWYRTPMYKAYEAARNLVRENAAKHLQKAQKVIEHRKKEGSLSEEEPNLVHSLLSDSTLEMEDIKNMIDTLYVAGTDSTAKNLQTLFYHLAQNPDKQEKLREEVLSVLGPDGPLTKESLAHLQYTKACFKESMRLTFPTPTGTVRILSQDVVLSGYRIPAGTLIGMLNPKMCRDYFVDADKFIPERWIRSSDGRHEEDIPKTALLPFGYGPRNCIGRRFAEQEIYLGVAKVLQKLRIGVEPESNNMRFIYTLFVEPEQPIRFTFTKI